jgi:predicted Abi (CAAX) family protease
MLWAARPDAQSATMLEILWDMLAGAVTMADFTNMAVLRHGKPWAAVTEQDLLDSLARDNMKAVQLYLKTRGLRMWRLRRNSLGGDLFAFPFNRLGYIMGYLDFNGCKSPGILY